MEGTLEGIQSVRLSQERFEEVGSWKGDTGVVCDVSAKRNKRNIHHWLLMKCKQQSSTHRIGAEKALPAKLRVTRERSEEALELLVLPGMLECSEPGPSFPGSASVRALGCDLNGTRLEPGPATSRARFTLGNCPPRLWPPALCPPFPLIDSHQTHRVPIADYNLA